MAEEKRYNKIAGEIDRLEQHYLVGREREISIFLEWLAAEPSTGCILSLYGTGGVGKSYLLDEFRRLCEAADVRFLLVDCRRFSGNPFDFCMQLLRSLRYPTDQLSDRRMDIRDLTEICLEEIHKAAAERRVVLALDTFEEIGELENWLREKMLTEFSSEVRTIISGRFPLQGAWLASPAWRHLIVHLPLAGLEYDAVKQYLSRSGIDREEMVRHTWTRTKGHPLTLSLFVSTTLIQPLRQFPSSAVSHIFAHVVRVWLKEVPDDEIRELVEATAIMRHFNQELLSFVLDKRISTAQFQALTDHSFIRKVDSGWMIHDMLRDAIGYNLRQRAPEYYDQLWKRCIQIYSLNMKMPLTGKSAAWERADFVYYIGDRLIRTLFYQQTVVYSLETLHASNWTEAERYVADRLLTASDTRIVQRDAESNETYEYWITATESVSMYKHASLQELYNLDPSIVKLIRGAQGEVCGMTAIVPIHEQTLDYLTTRQPSLAYFASLPAAALNEMRTSRNNIAGYFVLFIDVPDYGDINMRHAAGLTFINHMLSTGLIVTTAPAIPFFHAIFQSLGFEKVSGVCHYAYDDLTPAPYFVLDTRGRRFQDYLNSRIASVGISQANLDAHDRFAQLSLREREVVALLIQGDSNLEIARQLCLSEATVKKHISNVYRKLQVKKRIQLVNAYDSKGSTTRLQPEN